MLRFASLLGVAALAVHQLRYLLSGHSPGGPEHAYVGPTGALLAGILVLVLARVVLGRATRVPPLRRLWPVSASALLAVYCVQETAEGVAPFPHGGLLAVPLAVLFGLAIALLMRGASRAAAHAVRPWRTPPALRTPALVSLLLPLQARAGAPRLLPVRGPPFTFVVT